MLPHHSVGFFVAFQRNEVEDLHVGEAPRHSIMLSKMRRGIMICSIHLKIFSGKIHNKSLTLDLGEEKLKVED